MRSPRRGLTLIEVIVALLIASIGALAALSTQAVMIRERGRANVVRQQVAVASRVLDSLASISCTTIAGGSLTRSTAAYRWTTATSGRSITISLDVTPTLRSVVPWSTRAEVPCP